MKFESLVPILYSTDIPRSIAYYMDVLEFEEQWTWDEKPTFGGGQTGEVRIFFCKDGQGHPGTWICINLENLDTYYEKIKANGATILSPQKISHGLCAKCWWRIPMATSSGSGTE